MTTRTIDNVPVAHTPDGGWSSWPAPVHVVATYKDGVHVLRPDGVDLEVKRWREGDDLMWQYVGFTARMRRLGSPDADPTELAGQQS